MEVQVSVVEEAQDGISLLDISRLDLYIPDLWPGVSGSLG